MYVFCLNEKPPSEGGLSATSLGGGSSPMCSWRRLLVEAPLIAARTPNNERQAASSDVRDVVSSSCSSKSDAPNRTLHNTPPINTFYVAAAQNEREIARAVIVHVRRPLRAVYAIKTDRNQFSCEEDEVSDHETPVVQVFPLDSQSRDLSKMANLIIAGKEINLISISRSAAVYQTVCNSELIVR